MSKKPSHNTLVHDLAAVVMGLFALAMIVSSPWQVDTTGPDPFYKGPLIFPLMVLALMVAGALPSMIRVAKALPAFFEKEGRKQALYLDGEGLPERPAVMVGMLIAYIWALVFFGLEVSTFLFLVAALKYLKQDTPLKLALIPILVTAILYVVFKFFLDTWFPEPLILSFLGIGD